LYLRNRFQNLTFLGIYPVLETEITVNFEEHFNFLTKLPNLISLAVYSSKLTPIKQPTYPKDVLDPLIIAKTVISHPDYPRVTTTTELEKFVSVRQVDWLFKFNIMSYHSPTPHPIRKPDDPIPELEITEQSLLRDFLAAW
jgi:hypothetical protein